jgi:SpoVK/Ycf46/Vps4 family AAA+-type ATPase
MTTENSIGTFLHKTVQIKLIQLSILSQITNNTIHGEIKKIISQFFFLLEFKDLQSIIEKHFIYPFFFLFYEKRSKKNYLFKKKKKLKIPISLAKKKKNFKTLYINNKNYIISTLRYKDFAGIEKIINEIQELIEWPLLNKDFFRKFNIFPIRGILFHGPPGTGKTLLAHVIAGELRLPLFCLDSFKMPTSYYNENEKKLKNIFNLAKNAAPSIILIDEIDIIIGARQNVGKEFEKKIIGQLLITMDKINKIENKPVLVIASTNQIDFIDPALRRPGRFDRELEFKLPDFYERLQLLKKFSFHICFSEDVDLKLFALKTSGFVSGDLSNFLMISIRLGILRLGKRFFKGTFRKKINLKLNNVKIKKIDLDRGKEKIQPSILRQGFNIPKKICWKTIGGLEETRKILSRYIIEPIKKFSEDKSFKTKGLGFLLFGPSGCGKTLIAQVVAYESQANFIAIKGPEIFNKFLGESEKEIRSIFSKARSCSPCILFFDEIDSLAIERAGKENISQNGASDRILNQLLTEIDGINPNEGVFIIGATNRPDMIDKALLRHGRLDKMLYISLPDKRERIRILKSIMTKFLVLPYLNWNILSEKIIIGFTGADLMALSNESRLDAIEKKKTYCLVNHNHEGLFASFFIFLGSRNFLTGISKIKRNIKKKKI